MLASSLLMKANIKLNAFNMKIEKTAIVLVESYLNDSLIIGKVRAAGQLTYRMRRVLEQIDLSQDFLSVFCARYHFECLPFDANIAVDYVMDLDISKVFNPAEARKLV